MGTLYVVATPIGNLEDITLRALRVLGEADVIAAEDTRVTRKLLARHGIRTPVTSYHEHNKRTKLPELLALLRDKSVALVSDAGTPGVNDPGPELVSKAAEAGVAVVSIPGASAVTSAIAVSGLTIDQLLFLGFLPRKRADRRRLLGSLAAERRTLLAFEAPHRLKGALSDILEHLGDRRVAVCRELTKLHEEVYRAAVSEALLHFTEPKGEFTLVIKGATEEPDGKEGQEDRARAILARLRAKGARARDAVTEAVEETGLPRSRVYRIWLATSEAPKHGQIDRRL